MKQRRDTKQRQMILEIVLDHHDHPSADQIYVEVRAKDDKISRGTVYRNLNLLASDGEIKHVKLHGADRYDCRTDEHYHLICTGCGMVTDVTPMHNMSEMNRTIAESTGYVIEQHSTIFEGICPVCQKK